MREEVGYTVKDISDKAHKELTPAIIYQIFEDHYVTSKSIFQSASVISARKMEL